MMSKALTLIPSSVRGGKNSRLVKGPWSSLSLALMRSTILGSAILVSAASASGTASQEGGMLHSVGWKAIDTM